MAYEHPFTASQLFGIGRTMHETARLRELQGVTFQAHISPHGARFTRVYLSIGDIRVEGKTFDEAIENGWNAIEQMNAKPDPRDAWAILGIEKAA